MEVLCLLQILVFFFFYIHGQDALLKVVTVVYRVQINLDMSVWISTVFNDWFCFSSKLDRTTKELNSNWAVMLARMTEELERVRRLMKVDPGRGGERTGRRRGTRVATIRRCAKKPSSKSWPPCRIVPNRRCRCPASGRRRSWVRISNNSRWWWSSSKSSNSSSSSMFSKREDR